MKIFCKISALLIFTAFFCSNIVNAVFLRDPDQNNNYLKVEKNNKINYTEQKSKATDFTLENVTPENLAGATHYHIKFGNKTLQKTKTDGLELTQRPSEEYSPWISVVHYLYFNQLKNGSKVLLKIDNTEEE